VHNIPSEMQEEMLKPWVPLGTHDCFKAIDIVVSTSLKEIIDEYGPKDHETTNTQVEDDNS
jgi:hypothetical protein